MAFMTNCISNIFQKKNPIHTNLKIKVCRPFCLLYFFLSSMMMGRLAALKCIQLQFQHCNAHIQGKNSKIMKYVARFNDFLSI